MDIFSNFPQVPDCVKTIILARPDYRMAVEKARDYCLDLAIRALPGAVRDSLFASYQPKGYVYDFIQSRADVPDYGGMPYLLPGALRGSDESWWREYCIGLVAHAILSGTKETAKRLSREKVEKFLKEREQQMDQFMYLVYAESYVNNIDNTLKYAWRDAQRMVREAAQQYCEILKSSATMHEVWAASGMWADIPQELYHHYIKLTSLYLPPAQIDALIRDLKAKGLPVPAALDAGIWYQYAGMRDNRPWLAADELLPLCRNALNDSRILPKQGWWDVRLDPIWDNEYKAEDFFEHYCKDFRP